MKITLEFSPLRVSPTRNTPGAIWAAEFANSNPEYSPIVEGSKVTVQLSGEPEDTARFLRDALPFFDPD